MNYNNFPAACWCCAHSLGCALYKKGGVITLGIQMKRIVFCWELGGNYGHITGFARLGQLFRARGYEVIVVLRNLHYAELLGDGISCVQAPIPSNVPPASQSYSYTGILAQIGYLDPLVLTDYLSAWSQLLAQLKADLVVADHAPTPMLAARARAIPVAVIGTGFVIPPYEHQFPLFDSTLQEPDAELDQKVLQSINHAMAVLGASELQNLGEIFAGAETFVCSLPELDHYGFRADTDYWGPLFSDDLGLEPMWPSATAAHSLGANAAVPKIFAYLTPKLAHLQQAVAALAQLPGVKLVHIPGVSLEQIQAWSTATLSIEPQPVNMRSLLAAADMVVSQGGMGVTSLCALAAMRHVIIPTQMEQSMLARRLVSMGLVYAAGAKATQAEYRALFERALVCETLLGNSQLLAQRYQGFKQQEQLEVLVEELLALM
jgi:UDP:flavonoid glycosyltransferase YjiC (YdhE family)